MPEPTLYERLGGGAAVEAALDVFYDKVMADPRVAVFFDDVDVERVKSKQRAFLTIAFGGESAYEGRSLEAAHRRARGEGLNDHLFDVFMGHFRDTLEELGVQDPEVEEVMAIAYGGKADVMGRGVPA